MLKRCIAMLLAAVVLTGCPETKTAIQYGDEAAKAIASGRQLLRSNELGQADDALRQATKAVEQARDAAAKSSTPEALRAAQNADTKLSEFRVLLQQTQAAHRPSGDTVSEFPGAPVA